MVNENKNTNKSYFSSKIKEINIRTVLRTNNFVKV